MMTLALVAGLSTTVTDERIGGILFAGIAVTFGLVYLFGPTQRPAWALIPAGICLVLAIAMLAGMTSVVEYGWPVMLMLLGLWLLLRHRSGAAMADGSAAPRDQREPDQTAPQPH
jgi:hypothetical protein